MTRSALRLLGALFASLLLLPAGAQAAQITGDPLSIASADEDGKLGASFTGSGLSEFFGASVNTENGAITPARNAGFVVVTIGPNENVNRYGSRHENVTPTSAPAVTGDGSAGNPFRIVQTFRGNDNAGAPAVDIKQELTYVNGQSEFRAKLDVINLTGGRLQVRVSMGADLAGGGNDQGTGLFEAGPPRFVGGFNTEVGAVAGLAELTTWSHFEEGRYSEVLSRADANPAAASLQDRVEPTEVDNGAAVQWDQALAGLSPGQSANYEVAWRFARTYNLMPERQALNTGDTAAFKVTSVDTAGRPHANARVRYVVVGSNNAAGDVRTGDDGTATFEYVGGNPGTDRVSAYVDLNDNALRDSGEPEREATVEWTGPDAPQFATEVNARPTGRVLVRLPRGANVKGKWAQAAQSRFVRLTEAKQLPVGAEVDTKRGRVWLTSSKGPTGGVQTSQFYSGRFVVRQPRNGRGLTEVSMTEPMKCTSGGSRRGKITASRVRSRKLWGRGKGRFRTRGRRSAATVRGTTWLQKDTCSTTTTVVREGVVIVRDFAKRKNVRVKAPRRYVARARKR